MAACSQTYEIIRGIQEKAAEQCAPVIFGIKPSNLLIIDKSYAKVKRIATDMVQQGLDFGWAKQYQFG